MKIALIGYGKMGKTIEKIALKQGDTVLLKTKSSMELEKNLDLLKSVDVAIEFSKPDAAFKNIVTCLENKIPVVSGTTGWLEAYEEAKKLCKRNDGALLYASNFSIGVNIFFEVNKFLANKMNGHTDYTIGIEEIHHTQKKDQPSGTAITLANDAIELLDRKTGWRNDEKISNEEVPIISKRIDKVPGTHNITYTSDIDTIKLKHTAHSREGFAKGALMAAKWLSGRTGVFEMRDVLGFNEELKM